MTSVVDVADGTGLVAGHDAVKDLVNAVLEAEGLEGAVSVAFVDEASIADLNGRYREAEGPTDVLSFDYAAAPEWVEAEGGAEWPADGAEEAAAGQGAVSGEVVVCPQVVLRYAAEEGREPVIQLGWTLIHGTLHLAGYDHETDRGEMREREQLLLARLAPRVQALAFADVHGERGRR
jgi:probable rRNA maturation factor